MKVRWTRRALDDLCHLHECIAEESPQSADEMVFRIHQAVTVNLKAHPQMGKKGRVPGTRELVLAGTPYLLVYVLKEPELHIITLLHTSRRWPE
jgi:addiction module RelE/StbE family toxin